MRGFKTIQTVYNIEIHSFQRGNKSKQSSGSRTRRTTCFQIRLIDGIVVIGKPVLYIVIWIY